MDPTIGVVAAAALAAMATAYTAIVNRAAHKSQTLVSFRQSEFEFSLAGLRELVASMDRDRTYWIEQTTVCRERCSAVEAVNQRLREELNIALQNQRQMEAKLLKIERGIGD